MNDQDRVTISTNTASSSALIRWSIPMTESDLFGWPSQMTPNTFSAGVKLNLHRSIHQSNRALYRQIQGRQISYIQAGENEISNRAWSHSTADKIPSSIVCALHTRSFIDPACLRRASEINGFMAKEQLANVFRIYIYFCNSSHLVVDGQSWGSQIEKGLDSPEDLRGEGASTGCRSQLYSAVGITFHKKVLKADPICTLQLEHNAVRPKEFLKYYTGSTAYMPTYPAGWASWHSPFGWEFALVLLRATGERSHRAEYPRTPDERAGAAALVAAEEHPLMGSLNDCYWLTETQREQAICVRLHCDHTFVSLLLDYSSPLPSSFALTIGLIQLDGARKCNGTDGATGGHTIRGLRITARMDYRQLKIPQTESWQWDGPEALQRLCKVNAARRLSRIHACHRWYQSCRRRSLLSY